MRLKRSLAVVLMIVTIGFPVAPQLAKAERADAWEPTAGGWVSGPVEYLKTIPIDAAGGVSAKLHDGLLYVTTFRSFSIYDVADPENPLPLSTTPLGFQVFNEQPDTDGKILLMPQDLPDSLLHVWDVSDPSLPMKLASLELDRIDHMWTCIRDCRYAYSGLGTIVDLKDPADPQIVGDWAEGLLMASTHAIEEVAPGIVMSGTVPSYTLDSRKNPLKPKVIGITNIKTPDTSAFVIGATRAAPPAFLAWPDQGREPFALISVETPFTGQCSEASGTFATYDTSTLRKRHSLRFVDEFQLSQSSATYSEGRVPANVFGCSPYSFGTPPDYVKSRRVAVPWFEQGLRLLGVSGKGKVTEAGGFVPIAGSSSSAVWLTNEILYIIDLVRGIDILRVGSLSS